MSKRKKSKKKIEKNAAKRKAKVYAKKSPVRTPKKRVVKSTKRVNKKRRTPARKSRAAFEREMAERLRAIEQRESDLFARQKALYEAEKIVKEVNETILYQQGKKHLVSPEARKEIEDAQRRLAEKLTHIETPEERIERMRQRWREVASLVRSKYRTKREEILLWVQRNGYDIIEFWAEYRRRTA